MLRSVRAIATAKELLDGLLLEMQHCNFEEDEVLGIFSTPCVFSMKLNCDYWEEGMEKPYWQKAEDIYECFCKVTQKGFDFSDVLSKILLLVVKEDSLNIEKIKTFKNRINTRKEKILKLKQVYKRISRSLVDVKKLISKSTPTSSMHEELSEYLDELEVIAGSVSRKLRSFLISRNKSEECAII